MLPDMLPAMLTIVSVVLFGCTMFSLGFVAAAIYLAGKRQ